MKYMICIFSLLLLINISCKESEKNDLKSDVEIMIIGKEFEVSLCSDKISNALNLHLKAVLQNKSTIIGRIEYWEIEFFNSSNLIFTVNQSNYEDYACGDQVIEYHKEIVATTSFNYYGFIDFSFAKNKVPDQARIIISIKDISGYTYSISNKY